MISIPSQPQIAPSRWALIASLWLLLLAPLARAVDTVGTLDELRALDPALAPGAVTVAGYRVAGDGGGGSFQWDAAETRPDDGGLFIASNLAPTGRWARGIADILTPQMFGAVANGVTDDTAAIQATLDALGTVAVDTIRFEPGTYILGTTRPFVYAQENGKFILLDLGRTTALTGRSIRLVGNNARLLSTVSPRQAPIFYVEASFQSLDVEGITFEKSSTPVKDVEEGRSDGLFFTSYDHRSIDRISIVDCVFVNCHRSFTAGFRLGTATRGKIAKFIVKRCQFLYPYGANVISGAAAYSGGQMTHGGPWIDTMIYRNCLFDGASNGPLDVATCPGKRIKDGGHFGGPLHLIFEHNTVRHFSVEGLFKLSEPYLGHGITSFVMPPEDDSTPASFLVNYRDSDYLPGTPMYAQGIGYLTVRAFNPVNRELTVTNPGGAGNLPPGSNTPDLALLFDLNHPVFPMYLTDNLFDGTRPEGSPADVGRTGPGFPGISVMDTPAIIRRNTIIGCRQAIAIYVGQVPGLDLGAGTQIVDNTIVTPPDPDEVGGTVVGISIRSADSVIARNVIESAANHGFTGITIRGDRCIAFGNEIYSQVQSSNNVTSNLRSTGILLSQPGINSVIHANHTARLDVGVGPPWGDDTRFFAVGDIFSTSEARPVDMTSTTSLLENSEKRALKKFVEQVLRDGN